MTDRRTPLVTLVANLREAARDTGANAEAACIEAADRLMQMHADIATVLPTLTLHRSRANNWSESGRAHTEAVCRLAAEVLT